MSTTENEGGWYVTDIYGNTDHYGEWLIHTTLFRGHATGLPNDSETDENTSSSSGSGIPAPPSIYDIVLLLRCAERVGCPLGRTDGQQRQHLPGQRRRDPPRHHPRPGGQRVGRPAGWPLEPGPAGHGQRRHLRQPDPGDRGRQRQQRGPGPVDGVDDSSQPAAWQSHPKGIGYRSGEPAEEPSESSGGEGMANPSARTEGGTPQGSPDAELDRLDNADSGGNQTPSVTRNAYPTQEEIWEAQQNIRSGEGRSTRSSQFLLIRQACARLSQQVQQCD